jgi:DnaJ-class molecular chaperone
MKLNEKILEILDNYEQSCGDYYGVFPEDYNSIVTEILLAIKENSAPELNRANEAKQVSVKPSTEPAHEPDNTCSECQGTGQYNALYNGKRVICNVCNGTGKA